MDWKCKKMEVLKRNENRKIWIGIVKGIHEVTMTYLTNVMLADRFLEESLKVMGPVLRTMSSHQRFRRKFISQCSRISRARGRNRCNSL